MESVARVVVQRDLEVVREIATYDWIHPISTNVHERHVYLLSASPTTPDSWQWIETSGGQFSELEGYVFCFRWDDLDTDIHLAGNQGDYLGEV